MKKITQENNFIYLFISLIFLLFSMTLFEYIDNSWFGYIVEILFIVVFLVGVHSLKSERSWTWAVYAMVVFILILFLSKKIFNNPIIIDILQLFILLFFFIGSLRLSIRQILTSKEITGNMIIGSIVLFILLGLIWSVFYLLLLMIFPDGFNGLSAISWKENFSQVSYFSFVTLTTLGYGDISPKNSITQFFVYGEAIVGVFYMAIIVSSLVSARLNSINEDRI